MRKLLGLVFISLTFLTCGGGGANGLCQQIGAEVCAKACSCREGPTCAVTEGAVTLDFKDQASCQAIYVTFGCPMGDKTYQDAAACLPLLKAATCTGTGTEAALTFPSDMACVSTESQ